MWTEAELDAFYAEHHSDEDGVTVQMIAWVPMPEPRFIGADGGVL
jgi:hypothetical protein